MEQKEREWEWEKERKKEREKFYSLRHPFGLLGDRVLKCRGCSCMRCIVVFQCSPLWRGWPWTLWTPSQRRSCSPASCAARCYAAKHPWNATLPTSTPSDRRSTDASSASGYTARVTPWWPTYIPIIRADPATLTLSSFEGLDKVGTPQHHRTSLSIDNTLPSLLLPLSRLLFLFFFLLFFLLLLIQ